MRECDKLIEQIEKILHQYREGAVLAGEATNAIAARVIDADHEKIQVELREERAVYGESSLDG